VCAEPGAMDGIWGAARQGDLAEVERLVGEDPRLLDMKNGSFYGRTPLMWASYAGHLEVARWLLDRGAAVNERDPCGETALHLALFEGTPATGLRLQRGADPTIADAWDWTSLTTATAWWGALETVWCLLDHPSVAAILNHRDRGGKTALWWACCMGRGGVVRALLEKGADPTIADKDGTTPMAAARKNYKLPHGANAEGRRECLEALEVRCSPSPSPFLSYPLAG
jgi:ankyrin repeat protein